MKAIHDLSIKAKIFLAVLLPLIGNGFAAIYFSLGAANIGVIAVAVLLSLAGLFVALKISEQISSQLTDCLNIVGAIAAGSGSERLSVASKDEVGHLGYALMNLQSSVSAILDAGPDEDDERKMTALDVCKTNVMLADVDMNIVYMNENVEQMFTEAEADIRQALPNFNRSTLIGSNIDIFHKDPAHQRGMVTSLASVYETNINVGPRTFGLIATPLFDDGHKRTGTVVEWTDITVSLKAEKEQADLAASNSRIKQALDVCDTSVMMADEDLNIIYLNQAVEKMMQGRESIIREQLPNFSAKGLLGFNVDGFHKQPSHQRNMLKDLREPYQTKLPINGLTFNLIATPLWSEDGTIRLGTVVEWTDITETLAVQEAERKIAAENASIKQALDNVTANVMMADVDFNLTYMNGAVTNMMRNAQGDIRRDLPNFDANNLVGQNIDVFHKNPAHQRGLVGGMSGVFQSEIVIGGRTFSLIANPIVSDDGERLGTVVEWNDRTGEVNIEKEIDSLVEGAANGDFTTVIEMDGKEGFFKVLSEGLNKLMATTEVGINDVLRVLGAMAKGDLTETITRDYSGSFGQLKNDANGTVAKLTEIIGNIRNSADLINTAANEIATGNADLSQRTEEQASSLEETASSMEEMTSTVRQSADNSTIATKEAESAGTTATKGGEVVSQAVTAMEEINSSSKKIADIIGVIDEIAFQTNLLALNAAVEAARAGEQGRGFAVVAGEVRNLAQRSAAAAKEIKTLIDDSGDKVNEGSRLVSESGETLAEIVTAVESVSAKMREISESAIEQTSGIEQVNTAVAQMDEMTQQNAALVEEASAAGEAMAEQAESMSKMMEFFTLAGGSDFASAPSMAPVARSSGRANVRSIAAAGSAAKPMSNNDDWEEF